MKSLTARRPTLLMVDDTAADIDMLIDALGNNYTVRIATDGATALNSVKSFLPDLILLDIMMPDMSGFEVCRSLKDDPSSRDIPIIFLAALTEHADEERGLELGAVDYINKPFNPAIVKARVHTYLELRRHQNQLLTQVDQQINVLTDAVDSTFILAELQEEGSIHRDSNEMRFFEKAALKLFNLYKKMMPPENLEEAKSRIDELKSDNSLYKMFFESMTEAVGIISPFGNILFTNYRIPEILCYSSKEIINNNVFELLNKTNQVVIIKQLIKQKQNNDWSSYQISWTAKDGRQIPTIVSPKPIYNEKKKFIGSFALITEVTPLKIVEQQLRQSLEEKEVLFRELMHRTKNNMQVISSLIGLQSTGISDPKTKEVFKETQNRITSMATAHQMLYQTNDLTRIDFKSYLLELSSGLIKSYKFEADKVKLDFQAEAVNVSLEIAVTCGLVVNELISNSLKYAFPENRRGVIRMRLFTEEKQLIHLCIGDDGIGFADNFDFKCASSLGIRLITNLVKRQLKGTLEVDIHGSPEFRIHFKNVPSQRYSQLGKKVVRPLIKRQ